MQPTLQRGVGPWLQQILHMRGARLGKCNGYCHRTWGVLAPYKKGNRYARSASLAPLRGEDQGRHTMQALGSPRGNQVQAARRGSTLPQARAMPVSGVSIPAQGQRGAVQLSETADTPPGLSHEGSAPLDPVGAAQA